MIRDIRYYGLSLTLAAVTLLTATSASAFVYTSGGITVLNEGVKTSVVGAVTTDFNASLLNPSSYTGGGVKNGSVSGLWASPPADTSNYFTVGGSTSPLGVISIGSLADYFGFYWGSPDTYNTLELWRGSSLVNTLTGSALATAAGVTPNGNQSVGVYLNIFSGDSTEYFDTVKFVSNSNAFETDNHAVRAVPEPEMYALILAGLGLVGIVARLKKMVLATNRFVLFCSK